MRLYPDLYSRRFAWMFADLLMVAWIYLCVQAGLWVNNLVLQLDALAQGVISAGRSIYTLPYQRLLAYSRNPAEDWYLRRFEPLARAELERHGLTVERYFGVRPALEA